MAAAGLQTTNPLALGLLLEVTAYLLVADAGSLPITGKPAALLVPSDGVDIGTSSPLVLGMLLPTNGVAPSYVLTAATGSLPITGKPASLVAADPADVQTTSPLALGFLLTTSNFTLVADVGSLVLDFSPSDPEDFEGPNVTIPQTGGGPIPRRGHDHDEDDFMAILTVGAGVLH